MTASAHFTPYAIPLLMEKLASASSAARRDALDVLAEGLPVYGVLSLPRSASPKQNVWKLVSDTLFEREDDSEEAALRFVTAYVRGLSGVQYASEEARQANLLAQWVHAVLDDVKQYWTSDEVSLRSRVTARLLVAMAKASAQSAKVVVDYVLPSWTQRYHEKTAQKKFFLDGMQTLVAACAEGAAVNQSTERHCMAAYNDEVMEIVTSALGDAGLGSVALGVLAEILLQPGLLDEDEVIKCAASAHYAYKKHLLLLVDKPRNGKPRTSTPRSKRS